jgi:hypothetical protein
VKNTISISLLEGRRAVKTVRVACHRFLSDQKKTALNRLADSLGNLCCRQALPMRIAQWSLTSLQEPPVNAEQRQLHDERDDRLPDNGRRSIYRVLWLGLVCGICFSFLGPGKLNAQSQPSSVSLDATQSLEPKDPDGIEGPKETSQTESPEATAKPNTKPPSPPASGATGQSLVPAESKPAPEKAKKKPPRGALVPAPLPISSPTIGVGIIPALGYIFPFSRNDKISPPSVIGAAGMFTNNGSRGFGIGADLYMKEDTYEVSSIYARGNVNYNLYGSGVFEGLKLPLVQTGEVFRAEFLRRTWWKVFVGPRFWTGDSFVTLAPKNGEIPPIPSEVGLHTTMRALGLRVIRDTRPNQFYPTAGEKLEFTGDFFMQSLGSKYSFQAYRFTFNKYKSLGKNQVLAYDLFACGTGGQPPFYGNCIYGAQNELRGYTPGKYLDRYMAATQVEYRLALPKGFGLAAFGGLGGVIAGSSQVLFKNDHFLPDVGGGPRYELSKKYHVNLRTDFAKGRDTWTWSMGVGEAF